MPREINTGEMVSLALGVILIFMTKQMLLPLYLLYRSIQKATNSSSTTVVSGLSYYLFFDNVIILVFVYVIVI